MNRVVECVPNFSEGRDRDVIDAITGAMERAGATVLDVDMGAAANRTVVTMAGTPEAVQDAAFEAIKTASELIDMTAHSGEHPRMGATDVCPFVPVSGMTMDDCVDMAQRLGERVTKELSIPVFLYDMAASTPGRRSLADIRKGEYEGLEEKLKDPDWTPDFGNAAFNARSGATVIGAREFLIAYNINLNTRDRMLATRIAVRLREAGGLARSPDGEPLRNSGGKAVKIPGMFQDVRAVGWVIDEYGIAQISINLLDFGNTPIHMVYEEAKRLAFDLVGVSVTGSEIVGLVPEEALLMAGRYYLERQGRSPGVPRSELVHIAERSLGLSDVKAFNALDKVIEYRLSSGDESLTELTIDSFTDSVSMEAPVPGGGSVAALCGGLGAALTSMVAGLTLRRRELSDVHPEMRDVAVEAQSVKDRLLRLVTEDSEAFDAVMSASRLPRSSKAEKDARERAVEDATTRAAEVPLEALRLCNRIAEMASAVANRGYDNCLSDAGTAAATALAGAEGTALNVLINVTGLNDRQKAKKLDEEAEAALDRTRVKAGEVLKDVRLRLISGSTSS